MNLAQIVKMDLLLNRISNVLKEDATMQVKIPQLVTLVCTLLGTLGAPALMNTQVHAHMGLYTGLVAAAMILHALLPSIFGAPSAADQQATGMSNKAGLFLLAGLGLALAYPAGMRAQITPAPPTPAQIQNIYAAGGSYSVNAQPAAAGTALYAHNLNTGAALPTFAFTVVDASPTTVKPFTVTTNVGAGIAQQLAAVGKLQVFLPTAAGISWSGSNTGWQWNGGALISIHLKGQYYLMPSVRFLKSSVSGGSGYQPIIGLLFAWGQ